MADHPWNVLFLCSGNAARSIMAEAILRDAGKDRFHARSAGVNPLPEINPLAVEVLTLSGHDVSALHPKPMSEILGPDAPKMDFVFTVGDLAAGFDNSPWPGEPMTAHWGMADPAEATGTEAEKGLAYAQAYAELHRRITAFAALPFAELEKVALQGHLDHIGTAPAT